MDTELLRLRLIVHRYENVFLTTLVGPTTVEPVQFDPTDQAKEF